jgi:F-type H+-transporting ATPase subunit delta
VAVAQRVYAEALLEASRDADSIARVRKEFDAFAAALAESDELRGFLRNPQVETETKLGALDELLTGADKIFLNFVHLLAEKGRIS